MGAFLVNLNLAPAPENSVSDFLKPEPETCTEMAGNKLSIPKFTRFSSDDPSKSSVLGRTAYLYNRPYDLSPS